VSESSLWEGGSLSVDEDKYEAETEFKSSDGGSQELLCIIMDGNLVHLRQL
jgi:hypothetical protein